jgi:hypothetical protein
MRIDNGNIIALSASHIAANAYRHSTDLQIWNSRNDIPLQNYNKITISDAARGLIPPGTSCEPAKVVKDPETLPADSRDNILARLKTAFTGEDITALNIDKLNRKLNATQVRSSATHQDTKAGAKSEGWGIRFTYTEIYSEQERNVFNGYGIIKMEDGREFDFSVSLSTEKTYNMTTTIDFKAGDALKDPLAVDFDHNQASMVSTTRLLFELNKDGSNTFNDTIKKAGVYLRENEGIGTVQKVDIFV